MSPRFSRRAAVTTALVAPMAALTAGSAGAVGNPTIQDDGFSPRSTGFFTVPETNAILIGLLLPAVRKPRQLAQLQLADSSGKIVLSIQLEGGRAWMFDAFREKNGASQTNDPTIIVQERGGDRSWRVPSADGILIGLLLPAVQADGKSAGLLAGSVQIPDAEGRVNTILPYIEQDSVYPAIGVDSGVSSFVGPFTSPAGVSSLIGLLLPAVQGNFSPHQLLFLNSSGKEVGRAGIIGPDNKGGAFSSFFDIFVADDYLTINQRTADGSVKTITAPTTDGILIGLLLPAVQRNGARIGMLGGSLQTPGATVGFNAVNGD
jgi:hypothetical protein